MATLFRFNDLLVEGVLGNEAVDVERAAKLNEVERLLEEWMRDAAFNSIEVQGVACFADGSAAAPSIAFTQDTNKNDGIYHSNTFGIIGFTSGGAARFTVTAFGAQMESGQFTLQAGSASAPAITFTGDTDLGFYANGANDMRWSAGNNTGGAFTADGIQVDDGTVNNPSLSFLNDPDTGIYWSSSGDFRFANNGTWTAAFQAANVYLCEGDGIMYLRSNSNVAISMRSDDEASSINKYIQFVANDDGRDALVGMVSGNMYVWTDISASVILRTNNTNRFRVDGSGNVDQLTSGSTFTGGNTGLHMGLFTWWRSSAGSVMKLYNDIDLGTSTPEGIWISMGSDTDNPGTDDDFMLFRKNVNSETTVGSIDGNGSGGIRFNTTSDARLKSNIRDSEAYDHFMQMPWRTFEQDYRPAGTKDHLAITRHGAVAQEWAAIPELEQYTSSPKGTDDDQDPDLEQYWQLDYTSTIGTIGGALRHVIDQLTAAGIISPPRPDGSPSGRGATRPWAGGESRPEALELEAVRRERAAERRASGIEAERQRVANEAQEPIHRDPNPRSANANRQ